MRQKIIFIISFCLIGTAFYLVFFKRELLQIYYSSFGTQLPGNASILGIDISHHQGDINWEAALNMKIRSDSVQFVYLKVSEGIHFTDPKYAQNRKILDQNKVKVGVYHFFLPNINARQQAHHFIKSFRKTSLKPVVDVETKGHLNKKALVDSVSIFIETVKQELKVTPIIYTNESFYKNYFKKSSLSKSIFWIASYKRHCKLFDLPNVIAWQFSDKGTINGIAEKVDLNVAKTTFWEKALWPK